MSIASVYFAVVVLLCIFFNSYLPVMVNNDFRYVFDGYDGKF